MANFSAADIISTAGDFLQQLNSPTFDGNKWVLFTEMCDYLQQPGVFWIYQARPAFAHAFYNKLQHYGGWSGTPEYLQEYIANCQEFMHSLLPYVTEAELTMVAEHESNESGSDDIGVDIDIYIDDTGVDIDDLSDIDV